MSLLRPTNRHMPLQALMHCTWILLISSCNDFRNKLEPQDLKQLSETLQTCEQKLSQEDDTAVWMECLPVATNVFRVLRNACAGCQKNQELVR